MNSQKTTVIPFPAPSKNGVRYSAETEKRNNVIGTRLWFTIAYCMVVSICECPRIFCTCSMGIPLSMALVAIVRRNLCG